MQIATVASKRIALSSVAYSEDATDPTVLSHPAWIAQHLILSGQMLRLATARTGSMSVPDIQQHRQRVRPSCRSFMTHSRAVIVSDVSLSRLYVLAWLPRPWPQVQCERHGWSLSSRPLPRSLSPRRISVFELFFHALLHQAPCVRLPIVVLAAAS